MKKLATIVSMISLVALLALLGCSNAAQQAASQDAQESSAEAAVASADLKDSSAGAEKASAPTQESKVDWTDAGSAEEAAQGAGFNHFGVMEEIQLGDLTFSDPRFSYAGGVAQAFYEQGAAAVIVRKAEGRHTAPLTERDKVDFDSKWIENHNGVDVTLYGKQEGAATVIDWNIEMEDYTITYQGLGGDEMTMTTDEVDALVTGFMQADAAVEPEEDSKPSNNGDNYTYPITAEEAAEIATSTMGGTAQSVERSYSDLYGDCWYVALSGDNTVPIGCYVTDYGDAYAANKNHNPDVPLHQSITQDQAAILAAQACGGEAQSVELTTDSDGHECWLVVVENDKGETAKYIVNMLGIAYRMDG